MMKLLKKSALLICSSLIIVLVSLDVSAGALKRKRPPASTGGGGLASALASGVDEEEIGEDDFGEGEEVPGAEDPQDQEFDVDDPPRSPSPARKRRNTSRGSETSRVSDASRSSGASKVSGGSVGRNRGGRAVGRGRVVQDAAATEGQGRGRAATRGKGRGRAAIRGQGQGRAATGGQGRSRAAAGGRSRGTAAAAAGGSGVATTGDSVNMNPEFFAQFVSNTVSNTVAEMLRAQKQPTVRKTEDKHRDDLDAIAGGDEDELTQLAFEVEGKAGVFPMFPDASCNYSMIIKALAFTNKDRFTRDQTDALIMVLMLNGRKTKIKQAMTNYFSSTFTQEQVAMMRLGVVALSSHNLNQRNTRGGGFSDSVVQWFDSMRLTDRESLVYDAEYLAEIMTDRAHPEHAHFTLPEWWKDTNLRLLLSNAMEKYVKQAHIDEVTLKNRNGFFRGVMERIGDPRCASALEYELFGHRQSASFIDSMKGVFRSNIIQNQKFAHTVISTVRATFFETKKTEHGESDDMVASNSDDDEYALIREPALNGFVTGMLQFANDDILDLYVTLLTDGRIPMDHRKKN